MRTKGEGFTKKLMTDMKFQKKKKQMNGRRSSEESLLQNNGDRLSNVKEKMRQDRSELLENSSKVNFFSTLLFKMFTSFLVPVIFIIILGIVSFSKASVGIQNNYEKATVDTINMAGEFLRFGFDSVKATAIQYASDDMIGRYFFNIDDIFEANKNRNNISTSIMAKQVTDEFIENVYLISDNVPPITTSNVSIDTGFLSEFKETEIGEYLDKHRQENIWDGEDAFLDEKLKTNSDDYSVRLIRNITNSNSIVIIDAKIDVVNDILADLKFDKSGFLGLVTGDGREVIDYSLKTQDPNIDIDSLKAEKVFFNEPFYQEIVDSNENSGSKYVEYKGDTYLFMYSKIGQTGATLCALMPKSIITSQADSIKNVTIVIVIIACLAALIIAIWLSTGIDKVIKGIISKLKLAAMGDLTVQFETKRKDEFSILIDEIQTTFANMKELILQVKELSGEVSASASNVSITSESFLSSSEDISSAMNEIEQGINQQAKDAEECLVQMDSLSQKIELVSMNTKEIGQIADNTKMSVQDGTVVSEKLNQQTQSTIEITTDIIKDIEKLSEKSSSINKIINVINEIANQTNLLSLNASIEAARAGEHGKGFAVVASEIRTLAEQSKTSVDDIKKIIGSIQEVTTTAVTTALKAEEVLKLQESAVKNTTDSYTNINGSVEKLMVSLSSITDNVVNIEEARISTLGGIENISAVLEEIAASSNNINQTAANQVASVENLNNSAMNLSNNSEHLVNEVQKFIV